ncbi:28109_t:CDS:2, partial [Racocetra persica]
RSLVINPSAIPGQPTGPTSSIMSFNPPISIRTLVGHCTSPAYSLRDHAGQRGIYFIFQDLSVRTEGIYTLKFSLCDIKGLLSPVYDEFSTVRGSVLAEVYSAPFRVYSAKKFPGMTGMKITKTKDAYCISGFEPVVKKIKKIFPINNFYANNFYAIQIFMQMLNFNYLVLESTALSKAFATQGIKITIRKDFRYQKTNNDELQDGDLLLHDELLNQTNVTPDDHKDDSDEPSDTDSLQEIIKQEQ